MSIMLHQQSLEKQRTAEKERLFLVYAKQWWREFLDIRQSNHSKMVKIFAQVCHSKNKPCLKFAVFFPGNVLLHFPNGSLMFQ